MLIRYLLLSAVVAATPSLAAAQAPAPPMLCKQVACRVAFEWSTNEAPDPDRIYGSAGDLEGSLVARLQELGYDIQDHATSVITVRIHMEMAASCDAVPGMYLDTSCHAPAWADVTFASGDSGYKAPPPVEVHPRCSNSKIFPKMRAFGKFAAEMVDHSLNDGKGDRPSVKC